MAKPKSKSKRTTAKTLTYGQVDTSSKGTATDIPQPQHNNAIILIFAILISAFMIITPFYRGLFFRVNYVPAIIILSAIFLAYILYNLKNKTPMLNTYMDLAVLSIPIVYAISLIFAANTKDAFDTLLIYTSYFIIYKITHSLIRSNIKNKDIFVNVIIASTFLLSLTGMLHISGTLKLQGVYESKRLFGLYQYPNTTASVLGVGIILALNSLINTNNKNFKALYQGILTALISSFIFTLSRGGYLVLAGVLLLNFLLIDARSKLQFILSVFISFASSSILIYKFYTLAEEELKTVGNHYFISMIISAALIYFIFFVIDKIKISLSDRNINIALISLLAVFIIASAFLFTIKEPLEYIVEHKAEEEKSWKNKSITIDEVEPNTDYTVEFNVKSTLESPHSYGIIIRGYNKENEHTEILKLFEPAGPEFTHKSFDFTTLEDTEKIIFLLYNYETDSYTVYKDVILKGSGGNVARKMDKLKYVPDAIENRLKDIKTESSSVYLRIYFAKDGLKILKDYPIAGAGGGAWKNLYRQYQSIPYNTTETHNFYVQYATEVGVLGLIALGGVIILLLIGMFKSIIDKSNYLPIYLAAVLLLAHSALDFNLSLAAVGYLLWMLIGILNSHEGIKAIDKPILRYSKYALLVLSMLALFSSASIYYGLKLGAQAVNHAKEKDIDKAITLFEKAAKFDRYNTAYRYDLSQIMNNELRKSKDKKYYDGFMKQLSMIKKYEPYNYDNATTICSMLLAIGKLEEASALADEWVLNSPMVVPPYNMKIDANYQIARYHLEKEEIEQAHPYLEKVMEAEKQMEATNDKIKEAKENSKILGSIKLLKLTDDYPKKLEASQRTLDLIKEDLAK